jgi:hypothetical protein
LRSAKLGASTVSTRESRMECIRLVVAAMAVAALGTAVAGSGRTPVGTTPAGTGVRAPGSPDDHPVTLVRASGPWRAYAGRAWNRAW